MTDLVVSAPGKVILFGDHSVVYNRQAIASAISLRTTLSFTRHVHAHLILDFPDIDLHLTVSHEQLDGIHRSLSNQSTANPSDDLGTALMKSIESLLEHERLEGVNKAAALAFLYLYAQLGSIKEEATWGTYHITSSLPIGAGLGSSASVSVIIATALLLNLGLIRDPRQGKSSTQDLTSLELINKWAYVGEQCIHGNPSGVDNTVATFGGAVVFQKTAPMQLLPIPALPLLLTNTGVPRSTKVQVANVADLRARHALVVESILDAMHQISLEAQEVLSSEVVDVSRLGSLITLNHGLLQALGVSHPVIEKIVHANATRGYSKLIGAGGGGCVITLLKGAAGDQSSNEPRVGDIRGDGMEEYSVDLGGPGVGVHEGSIVHYY